MVAHEAIIEGTLTALIAGGHVLLTRVPGLAQTLLVRRLADALRSTLLRMQFPRDLLRAPGCSEIDMILDRTTEVGEPRAQPVLDGAQILEMARLARQVPITAPVRHYAIAVMLGTHPEHSLVPPATRQFVRYGSSPR